MTRAGCAGHHDGRAATNYLGPPDVIAVEPGTSRDGESARAEDLLLGTAGGVDVLTDYHLELAP